MRWIWTIIAAVGVLLLPAAAWAWGPFTHLLLARDIVAAPGLLPIGVAQLVTAGAADFLYGNVAADFVIAKNLASYLEHAHNWRNAWKLWQCSATPSQQAFALGYLAHLAADTVCHNYFIPFKLVESFSGIIHRHAYWEARFDRASHEQLDGSDLGLLRRRFPENDALHARCIPGTLFGFPVNRFLVSSAFQVQGLKRWQRAIGLLARRSAHPLAVDEREEQLELSLHAMRSFLHDLERSTEFGVDPRGQAALARARAIRRELKRLLHAGAVLPHQVGAIGDFFRPGFRRAVHGRLELPGVRYMLKYLQKMA